MINTCGDMKTQEKEICPDCGAISWSKKEVLKCDDCGGERELPSGTTPRTQGKQSEQTGSVFWRVRIQDDCLELVLDNRQVVKFDRLPGRVLLVEKVCDEHNDAIKAASRLCEIYFTIASDVIGETEVRSRRDALILRGKSQPVDSVLPPKAESFAPFFEEAEKMTNAQLASSVAESSAADVCKEEWEVQHDENGSTCYYICSAKTGEPVVEYGFEVRSAAQQFVDLHNSVCSLLQGRGSGKGEAATPTTQHE